jgi:hypothetical protein
MPTRRRTNIIGTFPEMVKLFWLDQGSIVVDSSSQSLLSRRWALTSSVKSQLTVEAPFSVVLMAGRRPPAQVNRSAQVQSQSGRPTWLDGDWRRTSNTCGQQLQVTHHPSRLQSTVYANTKRSFYHTIYNLGPRILL